MSDNNKGPVLRGRGRRKAEQPTGEAPYANERVKALTEYISTNAVDLKQMGLGTTDKGESILEIHLVGNFTPNNFTALARELKPMKFFVTKD